MKFFTSIGISVFLSLLILNPTTSSNGHQLFNSEERRIGGYIMQIGTDPEIPAVGKQIKILFRASDRDYNNLIDVKIGMRIYKDDALLEELQPRILSDGHFDKEYTFTNAGIHIVEVDLYTWDGNVITEKFNISTLNPFGYIFYSMVLIGVLFPASLFVFLLFHKKNKGENFTV